MKEKVFKILDYLIPCATVICVVSASLYIYNVRKDYAAADSEYAELEEYGVSEDRLDEFLVEEIQLQGDYAPETPELLGKDSNPDDNVDLSKLDNSGVAKKNNYTNIPEQDNSETLQNNNNDTSMSELDSDDSSQNNNNKTLSDSLGNSPSPEDNTNLSEESDDEPSQIDNKETLLDSSENPPLSFFDKIREFFRSLFAMFSGTGSSFNAQNDITLPTLDLSRLRDLAARAATQAEEEETKPPFRKMDIDFDALEEINPDTVGWICIPRIHLSYPVVQGEDNNYYLHYTFRNVKNSSGAIFLDSMVNADMSSRNTFIYGHNMKNKTMFGILKEFNGNDELLDNTYIYYYTKNHAYKYKVFANYITKSGSVTYHLSDDKDQLDYYLEKIQPLNKYEKGKEMDLMDVEYIITLSTCSGVNTGQRTVIQAYLEDDYAY